MSRIYRHKEGSETEKAIAFSKVIKLPWYLNKEENIKNFELIFKRKFTDEDKIEKTIYESKENKNNANS